MPPQKPSDEQQLPKVLPRHVADVAELDPQLPSMLILPVLVDGEAEDIDDEDVEVFVSVFALDPQVPNPVWHPSPQ